MHECKNIWLTDLQDFCLFKHLSLHLNVYLFVLVFQDLGLSLKMETPYIGKFLANKNHTRKIWCVIQRERSLEYVKFFFQSFFSCLKHVCMYILFVKAKKEPYYSVNMKQGYETFKNKFK